MRHIQHAGTLIRTSRACALLAVCAALAIVLEGCSKPVTLAVGPGGDITIITELDEDSPEVTALREGLEQEIVIIRPEPAFNVELSDPDGFDIRRNWRNLIFLGSMDQGSWVRGKISELLGEEQSAQLSAGERSLFLIRDKWAIGQLVAVLATSDSRSLLRAIEDNAPALYDAFERAAVENTRRILLKKDVQRDTARYLMRKYGWSIMVPDQYEVTEDSENRIILFRTDEPSRMILVHWMDDFEGKLTAEGGIALRDRLGWTVYDEDYVEREMTEATESSFLGREAIRIVGVWQNDKHTNGGPFRAYCFIEGDRLYLVDVLVYAPGLDKIPFLRELDAIAHTFETRS